MPSPRLTQTADQRAASRRDPLTAVGEQVDGERDQDHREHGVPQPRGTDTGQPPVSSANRRSPPAPAPPVTRSRRACPVTRSGRTDDGNVLGYSPSHAEHLGVAGEVVSPINPVSGLLLPMSRKDRRFWSNHGHVLLEVGQDPTARVSARPPQPRNTLASGATRGLEADQVTLRLRISYPSSQIVETVVVCNRRYPTRGHLA